MEGRTHRFLAFMLSTFVISLMTAFHTSNVKIIWGIVGIQILSTFFYNRASTWNIREKEKKKDEELKKDLVAYDKEIEKTHKKYLRNEEAAFFFMFVSLLFASITADFVPEGKYVSSAMALCSIPVIFAGATFPDWDWDFGEGSHRNPLLHSWVIPFSIWAFTIAIIPYEIRYFNFIPSIFCVAYATHMFSDTVTSTTTGTKNIIKEFFDFSHAPGNIKRYPEKWEHPWLFASGIILFGSFFFTIPRLYGTHGFDWDITNPRDPYIYILLGIIGISLLIFLGFYFRAQALALKKSLTKKKRKRETKKKTTRQKTDMTVYENRKANILSVFDDIEIYLSKNDLELAIKKKINDENVNTSNLIDQLRDDGLIEYRRSSPKGYRRT